MVLYYSWYNAYHMNIRTIILILALIILAGVLWYVMGNDAPVEDTGAEMVLEPPRAFTFTNAETSESITVAFNSDTGTAILTGQGYDEVTLTQAISASGARYVNEERGLELWNKGNDITLSQNDEELFAGSTGVEAETPAEIEPTPDTSDRGLDAHTWVWQETQMNNDEVITPNQADAFTLTFDTAAGRLSATTDCNSFSGNYVVNEDGSIAFGSFMMTRMYCEGSQENEFRNMVTESTHFMFTDAGDLVLLLKYDSGSVLFEKAATE